MIIHITGSDIDETTKDAMAEQIYALCGEHCITAGLSLSGARKWDEKKLARVEEHSVQIVVEL